MYHPQEQIDRANQTVPASLSYNSGEQKEFAGQIIKAQWMRVRRPNRHRSERSCAGTKIWKCWVKERIKRSGSSAFDFLQAWDAE